MMLYSTKTTSTINRGVNLSERQMNTAFLNRSDPAGTIEFSRVGLDWYSALTMAFLSPKLAAFPSHWLATVCTGEFPGKSRQDLDPGSTGISCSDGNTTHVESQASCAVNAKPSNRQDHIIAESVIAVFQNGSPLPVDEYLGAGNISILLF
jgi:hypothetical protein